MDANGVTRVPLFACARCGHQMDAVGSTDGVPSVPAPGDACGCIACGLPMVFVDALGTGALSLRPMTKAEFEAQPVEVKHELARVAFFAQQVYPRRN